MRSGSEEGSYSGLVDFCITQLVAESNKEEKEDSRVCSEQVERGRCAELLQLGASLVSDVRF
jgi:hypothetical protein